MNDPTIALGIRQEAGFLVLCIALIMGLFILTLSRQKALLPIVLVACFLPVSQKLVLADLNFSMLRVVIAFGWFRLAIRGEFRQLAWIKLDYVFLAWAVVRVITFTLLWQNTAALVNGLGYAFDEIGLYVLLRTLLRDSDDFKLVIRWFALAFIPLAVLMCAEKIGGKNPFYFLGGVPEFSTIRQGIIRAQGPFGHPILAGTFGAVWVPFFSAMWFQGKRYRLVAISGLVSAALITLASGSSGPIGSYVAGFLGLLMWKMRYRLRQIRWGLVLGLIALDVVMKDPVWFIFARVDVLSGSTGWHRAYLIDRTIANFGDWWLFGAHDISKWGVWAGDTTNQFVTEGVRGGLFTMTLFIWIVVVAFSYSGLVMKAVKTEPKRTQLFFWAIGGGVFVHVVSFMGVAYFDQNIVNWYLVLAMVAASYQLFVRKRYSKSQEKFPETNDSPVMTTNKENAVWQLTS